MHVRTAGKSLAIARGLPAQAQPGCQTQGLGEGADRRVGLCKRWAVASVPGSAVPPPRTKPEVSWHLSPPPVSVVLLVELSPVSAGTL